MKAELTTITEEMIGNKELADALNSNFNALNKMAEIREMAIYERINAIQKSLSDFKREMTVFKKDTKADLKTINNKIDKLMKHFGIDPDKDLLKG